MRSALAVVLVALVSSSCGGSKPQSAPLPPMQPVAPSPGQTTPQQAPQPSPASSQPAPQDPAPAPPAAEAPWAQSGIKDWTKPPAPTKEPAFKPPVPKRSKLKNGMSLLLIENHALPIVSMAMVVPGAGAAVDPTAKAGLASFTADLLDEGAGDLSAIQIAEEQDRLGASIRAYADVDTAGVSISTLTKTLDSTIDLATKIITQPKFDQKEFDRVEGDRMTSLELRRDRPREVAAIMLNAALYGAGTAYGHPASGMRETFKDITVADAQTFYKERWNPAVATLIIAGDFDPKALKTKLDATLGSWRPTGVKKPDKIAAKPAPLGKRLMLVDRKDAAQSDVRIGLVGIDRKDKRYYQVEVLANALGGSFTSRLNNRLREQLGITYGARAGEDYRAQPGPFLISTAIVTAATGQGLSETMKILDDVAAKDIPAGELEKAKQNLIRALPAQFDTNAATVGSFADLVTYRLPDNWYAGYAAGIKKVTAKDVRTVAKTLIPSKNFVISIVGDMAKTRAEIDKLGFGDAQMHDLYGQPVK